MGVLLWQGGGKHGKKFKYMWGQFFHIGIGITAFILLSHACYFPLLPTTVLLRYVCQFTISLCSCFSYPLGKAHDVCCSQIRYAHHDSDVSYVC